MAPFLRRESGALKEERPAASVTVQAMGLGIILASFGIVNGPGILASMCAVTTVHSCLLDELAASTEPLGVAQVDTI